MEPPRPPPLNWDYSAGQGQPPAGATEGYAEPVPFQDLNGLAHLFCCAVTIKPCLLPSAAKLLASSLQDLSGGPQSSSES